MPMPTPVEEMQIATRCCFPRRLACLLEPHKEAGFPELISTEKPMYIGADIAGLNAVSASVIVHYLAARQQPTISLRTNVDIAISHQDRYGGYVFRSDRKE